MWRQQAVLPHQPPTDWPAVVEVLDGIYATAINLRRALVIAARQPECA